MVPLKTRIQRSLQELYLSRGRYYRSQLLRLIGQGHLWEQAKLLQIFAIHSSFGFLSKRLLCALCESMQRRRWNWSYSWCLMNVKIVSFDWSLYDSLNCFLVNHNWVWGLRRWSGLRVLDGQWFFSFTKVLFYFGLNRRKCTNSGGKSIAFRLQYAYVSEFRE